MDYAACLDRRNSLVRSSGITHTALMNEGMLHIWLVVPLAKTLVHALFGPKPTVFSCCTTARLHQIEYISTPLYN